MFGKGEAVLVVSSDGKRALVRLEGGMQKVPGIGVLDADQMIKGGDGFAAKVGSKVIRVYSADILDKVTGIKRGAQIISPKDSFYIAMALDVKGGSRVVEGGVGSGALTMVLANLVGNSGKVHTYDLRQDFSENASKNLERVGLLERVQFKLGDVTLGVEEKDVDAFVIDIPNPQDAVSSAMHALRPGGRFAAYTPTMNQAEAVVKALRGGGFWDVRTLELLERDILVRERGTRPSTEMLGHTGYITLARRR